MSQAEEAPWDTKHDQKNYISITRYKPQITSFLSRIEGTCYNLSLLDAMLILHPCADAHAFLHFIWNLFWLFLS